MIWRWLCRRIRIFSYMTWIINILVSYTIPNLKWEYLSKKLVLWQSLEKRITSRFLNQIDIVHIILLLQITYNYYIQANYSNISAVSFSYFTYLSYNRYFHKYHTWCTASNKLHPTTLHPTNYINNNISNSNISNNILVSSHIMILTHIYLFPTTHSFQII